MPPKKDPEQEELERKHAQVKQAIVEMRKLGTTLESYRDETQARWDEDAPRREATRKLLADIEADKQRAKAKEFTDTLSAASHGDIEAMRKLARMYLLKQIIEQEGVDHFIQSVFWRIVAAKLGSAEAQESLLTNLEIDINDDLNDYENIPVQQIEQFLHLIETQGFIPPANQAAIFSTQEVAALQQLAEQDPLGAGVAPAHHAAAAAGPAPAVPAAVPLANLAAASAVPTATVEPAAPHEYGAAAAQAFGHGHALMGAGADHGGDCS